MNHNIVVSFVHAYEDLEYSVKKDKFPALWVIKPDGEEIYEYPFIRNVSDFLEYEHLIDGTMPDSEIMDFKKLPRFGLTGLSEFGDYIYAGSWNSIYEIKKSDFSLKRIISHPLMNDMHGIYADRDYLITILTGKDTIVLTDYNGNIIDHFTIGRDLTVYKNDQLECIDWRFLSKQFRGATGVWHFNYVQRLGDEIWLTSRNLGAIIVVNLNSFKAHIRTINHMTPVLLHDGIRYNNEYYFSSIDGKIIIAGDVQESSHNSREQCENLEHFTRDMVSELIRLEETDYGKEPNWCRGIACYNDIIYTTIDGRYGTDLSFGLLGLKRTGEKIVEKRLYWKDIGSEKDLRFVTGFDIEILSH